MKKILIFLGALISALALFLCCSVKTYAWEYNPTSQTLKSTNLFNVETMELKPLPSDYFDPPSQEEINEYGVSQWYEFICEQNTTYTFFALVQTSSANVLVRGYNQEKQSVVFSTTCNQNYVRRQFSSGTNTRIYIRLTRGEYLHVNTKLTYCMIRKGAINYMDNYSIKDFEPYTTYFNRNNTNLGYLPTYTIQFSLSSDGNTWVDTLKTSSYWNNNEITSYGATSVRITCYTLTQEYGSNMKLFIDKTDNMQKAKNFMVTLGHYGDMLTINYDDGTSDQIDTINGNYTFQFNNNKNITQLIWESSHADDSHLDINYLGSGYNQGYNQGYEDGNLDGFDSGYNVGYNQGLNDGELNGGLETSGFKSLINTIISYPINLIKTSLSFEIFGINVAGVIFFLLTLGLVIFVVKKFWK